MRGHGSSHHHGGNSHVECRLFLLRVQPLTLPGLSDQPEDVNVADALQLDHRPGQLFAHPALPLGQPRLQDVEYRHVLPAQVRLSLQIFLRHRVKSKPDYY